MAYIKLNNTKYDYYCRYTELANKIDFYYTLKSLNAVTSLSDFNKVDVKDTSIQYSSGDRFLILLKCKDGYKFNIPSTTTEIAIEYNYSPYGTDRIRFFPNHSDFKTFISVIGLTDKAILLGRDSSSSTLGFQPSSSYSYSFYFRESFFNNYVVEDIQDRHLKIDLPTTQNFNVYVDDTLDVNLNDYVYQNSVNIKLYPKSDYEINTDKNIFSVGFSSGADTFKPLSVNSRAFTKNNDFVELVLNDSNSDIYNTIFISDIQQSDIFKKIIIDYPYNVAFTTQSQKLDIYFDGVLQTNQNVFYGSNNPIKIELKPKINYKWGAIINPLPFGYNIRYGDDDKTQNYKSPYIYFIDNVATYTTDSKFEIFDLSDSNDYLIIDVSSKTGEIYQTSISDLTYTITVNDDDYKGFIKYDDIVQIDFVANDFYKFDINSPLPSIIYVNNQNNKIDNIFSTFIDKSHCQLVFTVSEIINIDFGLGVGGRAIPDVVIGQKPIYTQKDNTFISIEIDDVTQNFITQDSKNLYVRAISNDSYFFDVTPTLEITINNNVQSFNFQKLDSSNFFISLDLTEFNFDSIDSIIVYANSDLISDLSDFSSFKLFKLSNKDVKEIMSKRITIIQNDNYYTIQDYGKYIHSIKKFYCTLPSGFRDNIYLGQLLVSSNKPTIQDFSFSLSFGIVDIPKKYNNAMDSQKLEISLYLPFTDNDFLILDSEKYYDKSIELVYKISTISGDCVINIIDTVTREILDSFNGNVSLNLPFIFSDTVGFNQNTNINKTVLKELSPFIKIVWYDTIDDVSNVTYFDTVKNLNGFYKIDKIQNDDIFDLINLDDLNKIKTIFSNGVFINLDTTQN